MEHTITNRASGACHKCRAYQREQAHVTRDVIDDPRLPGYRQSIPRIWCAECCPACAGKRQE